MNKRLEDPHGVFGRLRGLPLEPTPYLKTRVLAELATRRREAKKLLVWKVITSLSVAFSLVLAVVFSRNNHSEPAYEAQVGRAFVVRIEVEPLRKFTIAEAEIDLPRGVEFYSEEFPELSQKKSLRIAWNDKNRKFPIVLRAVESGKKSVKVLFFDHEHNLVAERTFDIKLFLKGAS